MNMTPSNDVRERTAISGLTIAVLSDPGVSAPWLPGVIAQLRAAGAMPVAVTGEDLDAARGADVVLATSPHDAHQARAVGVERFVLWTVVQKDPGTPLTAADARARDIAKAVADSRRVLVFDESSRSMLESLVWNAAGKTLVLPRLSRVEWDDDNRFPSVEADPLTAPVLVVHVATLRDSRAQELVRYGERLRPRRTPPELLVVAEGDTAVAVRTDPSLRHLVTIPGARIVGDGPGLRAALAGRVGVSVLPSPAVGGDDRREDALAWAEHHGLAVWAAAGQAPARPGGYRVPILAGETPEGALSAAAVPTPEVVRAPRNRTAELFAAQTANLRAVPGRPGERLRVLLVGADFKFLGDLVEAMLQRPDLDVRVDQWKTNGDRPTAQSQELLSWANVVVCEFASRNAVWASRHVREDQRLILHLHGYELRNPLIHDIVIERVDTVVFVSEFYRAKGLATTGWPAEKTAVIANSVQFAELARPKHPDAPFHLGMAGYVPELKRLDRAVELLRTLRRRDDRFVLHLRGRHPWNYKYVWGNPLRRDAYLAVYEQLQADPGLRRSVVFDPFGPDMGNWYRQIGWALSPSTRETFHLAPVEGMASGALPVVWEREGAAEIFPESALVADVEQAAERIHALTADPGARAAAVQEAMDRAARYEAGAVVDRWLALLLHGTIPASVTGRVNPDDVEPMKEAGAGRAEWGEIEKLARIGLFGQAATLAQMEQRPPWQLPDDVRRTAAVVWGYPALGQRAHALVGGLTLGPLPGVRPPEPRRALVVASAGAVDPAVGSQDVLLVVEAARDDLDAHLSAVTDRLLRRTLLDSPERMRVIGDEVMALAGAAVSEWTGVPLDWEATDESAARHLAVARRRPEDPDPRVRVSLLAAAASRSVTSPVGVEADVPVPLEWRVGPVGLARLRTVGVVGMEMDEDALRPGCRLLPLTPSQWPDQVPLVDVVLLNLAALRRHGWQLGRGNQGAAGAMITALRRRGVPVALVDTRAEGLDKNALTAARRVDAVVAAAPEDVQRLHDHRILPTQVAVSLAPWGRDGVGTTLLLDAHGAAELALRMLRVPR